MRDSWIHLQATSAERALFADFTTTLQLAEAGASAAPANRLREVRVVRAAGGTWFVKVFHRTQPKNRLRGLLTAPRAVNDAEREAEVALALAARGIATARPVAHGTARGGCSLYVCAEVAGTPLRECLLANPAAAAALLQAAARWAGGVLAAGVQLPDLSAEHVFVLAATPAAEFAVIDLHNGGLGRPTRRALRRVLRHSRRSLRDVPLPRAAMLRAAVRLLRAAGRGRDLRPLLRSLPPLDTHARYEHAIRPAAYRARDGGRTARELACLRRVWPGARGELWLDSPCGVDRLAPLLEHEFGVRRVAADRAMAMLREGVRGAEQRGERDSRRALLADAARLPLGDGAVDGVVVFRFLHHLEPAVARAVLAEAARVARRWVVVSWFHPVSVHNAGRRLRETLAGRARTRHTSTRARLRRWLAALGYEPVRTSAELPFLRDFWVASFRRR